MKLEAPANKNYCAVVCELKNFVDLPNCDNVRAALIFGNSVIVSKSAIAGEIGLFFPVEAALSKEFCAANNLFRKPEWGNAEPDKKGFFEEHGRVKAVKFRGHKSEGFWIPLASLWYTGEDWFQLQAGAEFDHLGEHEICKKYVPRFTKVQGATRCHVGRAARAEDKIVAGQFRFHIDTENLRRNSHKLDPNSWISISEKWHGTSVILGNVLVRRELTWLERIARSFGVQVSDSGYGLVWSSRRVVKGVDGEERENSVHFYESDIWGIVAREVGDRIPKGYTLYGEIVGFTPEGSAIQKGYPYGCQPGSHRLVIYRATITNADGKMLELSWQQLKDFCAKYGFEMVRELWFGKAGDFVDSWELAQNAGDTEDAWRIHFMRVLEGFFVKDADCPHNPPGTPAEGIVLKVDRLEEDEAYKLKNFRFLKAESDLLDKGEADIETQQSEEVQA